MSVCACTVHVWDYVRVRVCLSDGATMCVSLCVCTCMCMVVYVCSHLSPALACSISYIALAKCSTTVLATALFDLPYFLGGRDISSSLMQRLSCLPVAEEPWSDGHARRPWSSVTPQLMHQCAESHSFPYGQPLGAVLNSLLASWPPASG